MQSVDINKRLKLNFVAESYFMERDAKRYILTGVRLQSANLFCQYAKAWALCYVKRKQSQLVFDGNISI